MGNGGAILKVELGPFARLGIEQQSGTDVADGVHEVLLQYTGGLEELDPGPPPRFFNKRPATADEDTVFMLAVDPKVKAALKEAASRYGMSMQEIVSHAVMVYLADADARSPIPT